MKINMDDLEYTILFEDKTVALADLEYYLILLYLKMRDYDGYTEAAARTMMMILFDQVLDNGEKKMEQWKATRNKKEEENNDDDRK